MGFTPLLARTVDDPLLRGWSLPLAMILLGTGILPIHRLEQRVIAQIVPDATLPTNSATSVDGTVTNITGGTVSGNYLFHSFATFSILEDNTARFQNETTIENIITRVTGNATSTIDGIIEAQGSADLFLLNPNGLVFGPNAQLNIGGSFIGSSADSITFDDGSFFSAVNPQAPPLLTVNSTIGLQYGQNPGALTVKGNGNNLVLDNDTLDVVLTNRPTGLQVESGQTLGLIGGDVLLNGGNLTAESGRVILGSVADSTVMLTQETNGWRPDYDGSTSGDITLSNAASVLTSGDTGAEIQLNADAVLITDASALLANTLGRGDAVGISIQATDSVRATGAFVGSGTIFPTSILAEVAPDASGSGGNIVITTPRLRLAEGAQISAGTLGRGDAGDIQVVSEKVNIVGGIRRRQIPSGIFVNTDVTGDGGDLSITAQQLTIDKGAEISANTFGAGDAGTIILKVDEINVLAGARGLGSSGIFAQSETDAGIGGSIVMETDQLQVLSGAVIEVTTFSSSPAGTLDIIADSIFLDGQSPIGIPAAISAVVNDEASGAGGRIAIDTQRLDIRNGAQLITSTLGAGDAGALDINAGRIVLIGGNDVATIISSAVEDTGTGQGGVIAIDTNSLRIRGGAQISTGTKGNGQGGDLSIQAQTIDIEGRNNLALSGIVASALEGNGSGGNLTMDTDTLSIQRNGIITASNFSTISNNIAPGQGPAGKVTIRGRQIEVDGGEITASTATGDKGNIDIDSTLVVLSDRGVITTNAAGSNGGNISIDTENLVAFNNSDITANANQGLGGRVAITANGLFGIQFRESLTPQSDITVTSSLGPQFNGVVELNTPDVDPTQGIVALPNVLLDPNTKVIAACEQFRGNELIITGRGGLPSIATQFTQSTDIWQDLRIGTMSSEKMESDTQTEPALQASAPSAPIVEAQFWQVDKNGYVTLMSPSVDRHLQIDQGSVSCS